MRKAGLRIERRPPSRAPGATFEPARPSAVFAIGVENSDSKALGVYDGPFGEARTVVMAQAGKLKAYEGTVAEGYVADTQRATMKAPAR